MTFPAIVNTFQSPRLLAEALRGRHIQARNTGRIFVLMPHFSWQTTTILATKHPAMFKNQAYLGILTT